MQRHTLVRWFESLGPLTCGAWVRRLPNSFHAPAYLPPAPCQGIAAPVAPGTAATGYREGEAPGAGYTETRVGTAEVPVVQQVGGWTCEWELGLDSSGQAGLVRRTGLVGRTECRAAWWLQTGLNAS